MENFQARCLFDRGMILGFLHPERLVAIAVVDVADTKIVGSRNRREVVEPDVVIRPRLQIAKGGLIHVALLVCPYVIEFSQTLNIER